MSDVESLVESKTGLRHLQLMCQLQDYTLLQGNCHVGVGRLYEIAKERGQPRESVTSDLEALQDRGWLWFEKSMAGIQTVVVNQAGQDVATEFKEFFTDTRRRTQQIRDDILNWLYDIYLRDGIAYGMSDFLKHHTASFYGLYYTEKELLRATRWLKDEEYITGTGAFGGELIRPELTTKAIRTIETGRSVNDLLTQAGVNVTEVHVQGSSGVNIAVDSSNVTQSNTLTQGQIENVEKMLGQVRALLTPVTAGISDEVASQAKVITGQLEEEIKSPAPQPTVVKAMGLKLLELAATGTVQGVVDALNTVITQGMTGIS
ncbi:hypothetical protein LR392_04655 [Arthrobacter sp. AK04]|uniref:hypothetical protein n=1 Tax=Arthrobacter sp. AK04 TaxID=2900048 RepID=UPI001E4D6A90|nr:hypothetical protein [Arthrobacter sp. AK04]MCD5341519.1 hypothetical protein [Arthrobacter sp. AK04]